MIMAAAGSIERLMGLQPVPYTKNMEMAIVEKSLAYRAFQPENSGITFERFLPDARVNLGGDMKWQQSMKAHKVQRRLGTLQISRLRLWQARSGSFD